MSSEGKPQEAAGLRAAFSRYAPVLLMGLLVTVVRQFNNTDEPESVPQGNLQTEAPASAREYAGFLSAMWHGIAAFKEGDYQSARQHIRPWAQAGEPIAQAMLGEAFLRDAETLLPERSPSDEAMKWFELAAQQDHHMAALGLVSLTAFAKGLPDLYVKTWTVSFPRSSEPSSAEMAAFVGSLYQFSFDFWAQLDETSHEEPDRGDYKEDADCTRAVMWYERAARLGHAESQALLSALYTTGRCIEPDAGMARYWLHSAAQQGYGEAQYNIGLMYATGEGVPRDDAEAVRWFRRAAEQGLADAQNNLGVMYAKGRGVPQDDVEAVRWYRLAAEKDYAEAQFNLGGRYASGQGVPLDHAEAVMWFRKAAEQGLAAAQTNLGAMHFEGRGVPQDDAEAARWFRRAAEQGDAEAQCALGLLMYANGRGVAQDYVRAHAWLNLAGNQGLQIASEARDAVATLMTAEQVAEVQRLAAELAAEIQAANARRDQPLRLGLSGGRASPATD